jgi:ABC-2 type transport system permease protein
MKKYLHIGKVTFQNNIAYATEFFFRSIFIVVILFIFANMWRAAFGTSKVIEGFTVAMMVWYLLIGEAIVTSESSLVRTVNGEIQSGEIAYVLNKPYNYILYHFARSFSYRIISFFYIILLGSVLLFFLVGPISINFFGLVFVAITILFAFTLDFLISFLIGLLGFWLEDTEAFRWLYTKIIFTIGGMLMPLEMFPKWLEEISRFLPFNLIAYAPAKLFVNFNINLFLTTLFTQIIYIIIFGLIVYLVYSKAIRRVNINGG